MGFQFFYVALFGNNGRLGKFWNTQVKLNKELISFGCITGAVSNRFEFDSILTYRPDFNYVNRPTHDRRDLDEKFM